MNKPFLESHIEFGGPNKVIVTVAVETAPKQFEAFQKTCSSLSHYDLGLVLQYGVKLEEAHAHFIFPDLGKNKGYYYDNTEVVGAIDNTEDPLTSVSNYYEGIKDDVNCMVLSPEDIQIRANALDKLRKLRDLVAPHMVKHFTGSAS